MTQADHIAIETVIRIYFESMFESDKSKVDQVFHPNAKISGVMGGKFTESTRGQFGDLVARQQPSEKASGAEPRLDILEIHVAGETAVARVRDDYLGLTFLDTLSLVKIEGEWLIYNKLFHVEGKSAAA